MRFDVPKLEIDARIAAIRREPTVMLTARQKLERKIAWNVLHHVVKAGFELRGVYDGEEYTKVSTPLEAMEQIFDLDEASVRVRKPGFKEHEILLILGNGEDIVSDWTYTDGDPDGFSAAMDAVGGLIEKLV